MTFDDVRRIASQLQETVETTSYGTPSFKLGRKMLCRLRDESDVLVVPVAGGVKEAMIAAQPEVYFETPHYANTTLVLVRLTVIDERELTELLSDAWWLVATPSMRQAHGDSLADLARDR